MIPIIAAITPPATPGPIYACNGKLTITNRRNINDLNLFIITRFFFKKISDHCNTPIAI